MSRPGYSGHSSHSQTFFIFRDQIGSCVSHHLTRRSNCLPRVRASGDREVSSAVKPDDWPSVTHLLSQVGVTNWVGAVYLLFV